MRKKKAMKFRYGKKYFYLSEMYYFLEKFKSTVLEFAA